MTGHLITKRNVGLRRSGRWPMCKADITYHAMQAQQTKRTKQCKHSKSTLF